MSLFPEMIPQKNRRLTPAEMQEEKILADIFKRPVRHFLLDRPFYPYVKIDPNKPKYMVNFDLNYQ